MYSRLVKALKMLGEKCTAAGTKVEGDNVDGVVECIAKHYAGGGGADGVTITPIVADRDNVTSFRELATGFYTFHGYFTPYFGSDVSMSAPYPAFGTVINDGEISYVQILFPYKNQMQYLEITDDSYKRSDVKLANYGEIQVSEFQKVMEHATSISIGRDCETLSEVISSLAEKLSFGEMNGEFEYSENLTDGEVTSYSIKGIGSVTNTDLVFPETYNGKPVTELNSNAFMENTTITSIVIPDSYTSIGMNAFRGCTALESAVIGNGITGIGTNVFLYAELKRVKFGNSITRITSYAFNGCPLELLDFREATSVPTLDDGTIFVGMAEGCQIVVPDALYEEWVAASLWRDLEEATYVKASEYTEV